MVSTSPAPGPEHSPSSLARLFYHATIYFSAFAIVISAIGILGYFLGLPIFSSILTGYKTIAVSAAVSWILLGILLIFNSVKRVGRPGRTISLLILDLLILYSVFCLIGTITGVSFPVEEQVALFFSLVTRTPASLISPVASVLILLSAVCLVLLLVVQQQERPGRYVINSAGLLAGAVVIVSFTFSLSYLFGAPFFYTYRNNSHWHQFRPGRMQYWSRTYCHGRTRPVSCTLLCWKIHIFPSFTDIHSPDDSDNSYHEFSSLPVFKIPATE